MTTAEQFASMVAPTSADVSIAGVPWPRYKVVALVLGFALALVVGLVTMSAPAAVLSGAASAAVVWATLGYLRRHGS